jgi:hypothetical protein
MEKPPQSEEKINQKYRKRYQSHPTWMGDKHLPNSLIFELMGDYRELKSKILWKILFLKRKIERIRQNSVPDHIPKINERRLRSDLVKAEIILEVINSQIKNLEDLRTEFFKLERTYDQRMKISNVSELSDYKYF